MKILGLLGGLSWHSTAVYYRLLNEGAQKRLGGQHAAKLVLWSFDFHEMTQLKAEGKWERLGAIAADAARRLETSGAEALVICSNTMHRLAPVVRAKVNIPLIHILEATAEQIVARGSHSPILLGTRYTMEGDFAAKNLFEHGQIEVRIPDENARDAIHRIIYSELCEGVVNPSSKETLLSICEHLIGKGADGVILGCTELAMILSQKDFELPVFDTTTIHANAALEFALGE